MSSISLSHAQASDPLEEIRHLVQRELPPLPAATKTDGMLGDFAPLWRWLAAAQHQDRPRLRHPRIALFFAAYPDSLSLREAQTILARLKDGTHPVSPLVQGADADLQAYELDIDRPLPAGAKPFSGAAEAAQAIAYGMMAVQPGIGLLLVNAPNRAADTAAKSIRRALDAQADPLEALMGFGGHDIAAMAGAIIAARLAKIPVLLEGEAALAAAETLRALNATAADHARDVETLLSEKTALPPPCRGALLLPLLKAVAEIPG